MSAKSNMAGWKAEAVAVGALAALAVYFIWVSWRKWPDPIADSGPQWHTLWQLMQGARLYHDVTWNYGPLSPSFGAVLFAVFGPGMMVIATANLIFYWVIVTLAYLAFRKAWGWPGAFAALGVFISVFSFSRLNEVANYNYATPYANESTHGFLLLLVTALVVVRWCHGRSWPLALALGLCGGVAAVLKPEFMLAGGALGLVAVAMRTLQRQRVGAVELLALAGGVGLPTALFTLWFARGESLGAAFVDASQAWWLVLVDRSQATTVQQQLFLGLDRPWLYGKIELLAAVKAAVAMGAIWAAGWMMGRPWKLTVRVALAVGAGALVYLCRPSPGWLYVGGSFPGLLVVALGVLAVRVRGELRRTGRVEEGTLMAFALALLGATMLARMLLHARVTHLGFYQAALAGMVIAAFLVAEIPRWTGGGPGRCLAMAGGFVVLGWGCTTIAMASHAALVDQTVPIGTGRDRFYASVGEVDPIGPLVNWVLDQLKTTPPEAKICVLPEGEMINYLLRRPDPLGTARTDEQIMGRLRLTRPDYVVFISRNLAEVGVKEYGAPGGPGYAMLQWLRENKYPIVAETGGNPLRTDAAKGAAILRRPGATNAPAN
jgi:hypothetical protein